MKIESLQINNFRNIEKVNIDFSGRQTTVFVGINGSGKTSILDCTAIMLSRVIGRIQSTSGTGRFFSETDIRNGKSETSSYIEVDFWKDHYGYRVSKTRKGSHKQTISNLDQIKELRKKVRDTLEENSETNLPIAVFYPVNRAVLDIPLRIRKKHFFDQLAAYEGSLVSGHSDFRVFFEWFRNREDLENEMRLENRRVSDNQLEAVREAVSLLIPGFSKLRIRREPLRMTLEKNGRELIVNQLSDGEKCLLALAGDLARRLAIANPSLNYPLIGEGIVLIDEIELHLHPSWQREIVPKLESTFPNCQFIISTHSPLVISHVKPESLFLLSTDNEGNLTNPRSSYGRDINSILEEIMGVSERPVEIKNKLREYFYLIDEGKLDYAHKLRLELENSIGSDEPEFAKADVLLRRKEILGK